MTIIEYKIIRNINLPYRLEGELYSIECVVGDSIYVIENVVFYKNIYKEMSILHDTIKANPHFFKQVKIVGGILVQMPPIISTFTLNEHTYSKYKYNFRSDNDNIILSLSTYYLMPSNTAALKNRDVPIKYINHLMRMEKLNEVLS